MSSLLPSGCILIGMSCFFLYFRALWHTVQYFTRTHARSLSRLPLTLPGPECKREFNIAYFCAHTKKKKIVSGIRFVCHLPTVLFPSPFFLTCLLLLLYSPPLPLLLLMHIHICVPCVLAPKEVYAIFG